MDIYVFVAFIGLVAAILNIILFFKVWGMTNNVKMLRGIAENFTNIKYLLDKDELVNYSEYKKLIAERNKAELDFSNDYTERSKVIRKIDKQIRDLYL